MTDGTITDPWTWRDRLREQILLPARAVHVPTERALGRTVARFVHSPEALPALPLSAMDGFALRHADLQPGTRTVLPVAADLPAAPGDPAALRPGAAARIMTGAPIPAGADTVVAVEDTDAAPEGPAPDQVRLPPKEQVRPGRHVRDVGEEVPVGTLLAAPGDTVRAGLIGLAAALGMPTVPVRDPVRVSVLVTGDELTAGPAAGPGTVRESNGVMLAAALESVGATVRVLRSGDDEEQFRGRLRDAADGAELVVTTGGIGSGARDVVKLALGARETGTSTFAHLDLRPGGPQGWGRVPGEGAGAGVPLVHLPGTPVGALVGAYLFVRPLLSTEASTEPIRMRVMDETSQPRGRGWTARPGRIHHPGEAQTVQLPMVSVMAGSRLRPYARADALVLQGPGDGHDDGWVLPL